MSLSAHWDTVYQSTADSALGWYENDISPTLSLLETLPSLTGKVIFIPGVGTSQLVEALLSFNSRVVINDISIEAINSVIERLGKQDSIESFNNDISQPINDISHLIDIWIDRAVFHFLTEESQQTGYLANLNSALKVGGYALFAEFSSTGATKCAGLPVKRYSLESLSQQLGDAYQVETHFEHTYINKNGDPRPYLYVLYKRIK